MISTLRHGPVRAEHDVERHDADVVAFHQLRRQVRGAVGDYRDAGHLRAAAYRGGPYTVRGLAKVLVTGATGFIGSRRACSATAVTSLRLGIEKQSPELAIAELEGERVRLELRDRRSVRRALAGVERVFHCGGVTSVRPADADRLFDVNVGGTKLLMQECLRAGVERVVYTSSAAAVGPALDGKTADETQLFTAARLGIPYVNSVHEAEVEALRVAAQGLPLVCVNPAVCFGAGDYLPAPRGSSAASCSGGSRSTPTWRSTSSTCATPRRGHLLADERGAVGERYLLGGRNFTFERLFADLGRLSGSTSGQGAQGHGRHGGRHARSRGRWPLDAGRGARRVTELDLPLHEGEAGARLAGAPARGDARRNRRLAPEREHARIARSRRSQQIQWRSPAQIGAAEEAAGLVRRLTSATTLTTLPRVTTLYRCKAPTDLVCRCGEGSGGGGVDRHRWVPVLVHQEEVIHDSHRILEYLEWLNRSEPRSGIGPSRGSKAVTNVRRLWPYLLMAWERWWRRRRRRRSSTSARLREAAERGRKAVDQRRKRGREAAAQPRIGAGGEDSLTADRRANPGARRLAGRDAHPAAGAGQGGRSRDRRGAEVARGADVVPRRHRLRGARPTSLEGNTRRAIDLHEDEQIDAEALGVSCAPPWR